VIACRGRLFVVPLFAVLSFSAAHSAEPQPFEMARTLQLLQDDVAHGGRAALEAQQKLLGVMAERFVAMPPQTWKDRKNIAALIVHVLSGGGPGALGLMIERRAIAESDLPLAKGALAYAEGRNDEASALLLPIDARTLLPELGGHVALAQSSLVGDKDPKAASRFLDTARLLAPGTLVEEAAIRREIIAATKDGDIEKFESLSRQQITRFANSVYAGAFRHQLAESIVRLDYGAGRLDRLREMVATLEPSDQRDLYLMIARQAVVEGRMIVARFAADQAANLPGTTIPDTARAQLYAAAALIVTNDFETAREKLKAIDGRTLDHEDSDLLARALNVADQLRAWPKMPPRDPPPFDLTNNRRGSPTSAEPASAVIARATKAISEADEFLRTQSP
jgi:chemotaxis protein MotC